ncbi:NADH:flavin oxidoreductase [Halovenus halobia]|uniref:oxidoreductase n=1 Tax=Halovenus halobia TaxID=3396622 RepID=UPI003F543630
MQGDSTTTLTDSLEIGGLTVPNRLYRAPLLECAGNGPGAVETYIDELEPAAEAGAGLIFQGASIVTEDGGCAAPNMTRVHNPEFVDQLSALTDRIHEHDSRIFIQLAHGGLRSLSLWHSEYREQHPGEGQLAVSKPPWQLRAADRAGLINVDADVLSTSEVRELAESFGRAAGYAADAGYDGIHLSGANMGIIQQFLSPYYNDRDDEFADGVRFLLAIRDAVREHAGDIPLVTKVPAETAAPPFVRRHLTREDGVHIAARLAEAGYDALVPVECSVYWDASLIRGAYPDRAWSADDLSSAYEAVFGGRFRARAVSLLNRLQARQFPAEPGWNADFCRAVREAVDVPVLCEGGLREREHCEELLDGGATDMVGIGRPFYAEPRLPARLLRGERALCGSCNNCTVPQATGEPGRCRTPEVVRQRAQYEKQGAYDGT